jgi:bloom syndrome protein
LNVLRQNFPNVPIMALTATANSSVVADISSKLAMRRDFFTFKSSFNRPNLRYTILKKTKTSLGEIAEYIKTKQAGKSGIIYCLSRKNCEQVSDELKKALPHMASKITYYHAELEPDERARRHTQWTRGNIKLIVATVAFGMGINKPDVRYVIHYSLPKSLTHYYQESGRAGRDGLESDCLLYFTFRDKVRSARLRPAAACDRELSSTASTPLCAPRSRASIYYTKPFGVPCFNSVRVFAAMRGLCYMVCSFFCSRCLR